MNKPKMTMGAGAVLALAALYLVTDTRTFAALLIAAAAHEAGHLAAIPLTGGQVTGISADAGGAVIHRRGASSPYGEAFCAVMGPATGLLFAFAASAAGRALGSPVLTISAGMNVVLSLFNMLPASPLDGWRIVSALTGGRVPAAVSVFFACAVLLGGLALAVLRMGIGLFIAGIWLVLAQTDL